MAAVRKYINVATELFTAQATGDVTITCFRITDSTGATVKSNFKALASGNQALVTDQRMEIQDQGFYVEIPDTADITDARKIAILDAEYDDTDKIEWGTGSAGSFTATALVAPTSVVDWDNAATV